MTQLLAGIAEGGGLVGAFEPGGLTEGDERALRRLTGEGSPLRASLVEARKPQALVCGEIFEIEHLADELGLSGAQMHDVLEAGFQRWSLDVLPRLRGSFALLVVPSAGAAVLGADAGTGHSIVYHAAGTRLLFASEIHLLLRLLPSRPAPNPVAVVHALVHDPTRPPGITLYEGISEIVGGECLELSASGWKHSRFWEPRYRQPAEISRAGAGELVWQALTGSVGARLGRDGDVGIVMSSGVDSSTVAAAATSAAAGHSGSRLHSYSAVFPGQPHLDESDRIDSLVTRLGLRNTQVEIRSGGALRLSLEWLEAWGLPLVDFSYPMERVLLDVAASAGVQAVLDGQYGDESFGAPVYLLADRLRHGRVISSIRLARRLPTYERSRLDAWRTYGLLGMIPLSLERAYSRLRPANPGYLTGESARLLAETDSSRDWKQFDGPRWWAEKAHLLTVDRQADGISAHVRHRAALSGLTARPPLFDLDVIETLLRIPPVVEFDPLVNKVSAREAVRGRIPEELRESRWKSDLGPYILAGLAGPDLEGIRRVLAPPLELGAYVHRDAVQALMSRPPRWRDPGWRDWTVSVYKLLTVESWLRSQSDPSFARTLLESDLPTAQGTIRRTHSDRGPATH